MLLLAFLLIPAILAVEEERTINNHVVKINGDTLISVNPTPTSSRVLNLSGLGLRILQNNSFDNLPNLKNLDLGNNSLSSIPKQLFSKLGNLEHLSVANNNLTHLEKVFEGLDHLKTLNITNNPINSLRATELSGLPKSSVVFTKGLSFEVINAFVFEKEPGTIWKTEVRDDRRKRTISNYQNSRRQTQEQQDDTTKVECRKRRDVKNNRLIKICIDGDVLKRVELLKNDETLPSNCRRRELNEHRQLLDLENLGIAKFKKNWYRLDSTTPIIQILFAGNNIVQVTPELINDLPMNVRNIDLGGNKIERLEKDVFDNAYIGTMNLSVNAIREIEDGAFSKMLALSELYLDNNLLENTKFMATLPRGMGMILVQDNKITEISPGSFSKLGGLMFLYLNGNLIQEVKSDAFRGLRRLVELILSDNRITNIEAGAFQQARSVYSIGLNNNSLVGFNNGVFDNLPCLERLDVSYNKLSNIKKSFPNGLPTNLTILNLRFNEIDKLESDNFKNLPLRYLVLSGNKISEIEHGALELRYLRDLKLDNNRLSQLDADSFRGLRRIEELELSHNRITSIPKGFTQVMPNLDELDLSNNPIHRLQNGALYGFRRTSYNRIYLSEAPVEVIEGGLFDDL